MNPITTVQMLMIGLLTTAGAACSAQDSPGPSDAAATSQPTTVPSDATIASQPAPNPQTLPLAFSPSAVCDVVPLDEPVRAGGDTATVRFVAYGDVDGDDDVPCGMLPDVRIAVISQEGSKDKLLSWWTAVGGYELGIETFIPPGARVPTTSERMSAALAAASAQFVTTGPGGIAEVLIDHEDDYSLCAISPANDLIAGCYHYLRPRGFVHITVYIYFIHGHAIIETEGNDWYQETNDRYQRFLDDEVWSGELATVTFNATDMDDIEPSRPYSDVDIIVIGDDHVNAWWAAVSDNVTNVSDNGTNELDADRVSIGSEVLAHNWVHVITTGPDGLAETALSPGDYLICSVAWNGRLRCVYENLASGYHMFEVNFWEGGGDFSIRRTQNETVPSNTVVASQPTPIPRALPVAFSPSAVCDVVPLDEPVRAGNNTATVRIVAYGDVDREDDVPCGMLSGMRIYAIREELHYLDVSEGWWTAVAGDELGERYYPLLPGVRVPTTAERLSAVPEQPIPVNDSYYSSAERVRSDHITKGAELITAVTTGPNGIVELSVIADSESDNPTPDYGLCAISPVDNFIAGCFNTYFPIQENSHITAYIYFTHGHAIVEIGSNDWWQRGHNDRYQRFLDSVVPSGEPAIIKFEAISYDDIMVDGEIPSEPVHDMDMMIIGEAHVNAWWAAIFGNESYDYRLSSEALAHDWVHVVTTDLYGLAETVIPPGDYLICSADWSGHLSCVYENLISGLHKFKATFWDGGNALNFNKLSGAER